MTCLQLNRTPSENVLFGSIIWGLRQSHATSFRSFQLAIAGPYLHEDIDETWDNLRQKMRWNTLHILFTDIHNLVIPLDKLEQMLLQPDVAVQINLFDIAWLTPLYYAVNGHPETTDILLRAGANPWLLRYPLTEAVEVGADSVISPLIRAGVYVNHRNRWKRHALHYIACRPSKAASSSERYKLATELVRHGGHLLDWEARDKWGNTPVDEARKRAQEYPNDSNFQALLELFLTHEVPPRARCIDPSNDAEPVDQGDMPAHQSTSLVGAGIRGDVDAIGELIRLGAMVNERDGSGNTVLHLAAMGRVQDGFKVALEVARHGGYGVDWDARTVDGLTALELMEKRMRQTSEPDDEAERLWRLLWYRELPSGERYVYPCMDPNYCPRCSSLDCTCIPMPGAWE